MRVYELATELKISSKDLLAKLHELGVEAKSHMSALEPSALDLMREAYAPPATPVPEPIEELPPLPEEDPEVLYWAEQKLKLRDKEPLRVEPKPKAFAEKRDLGERKGDRIEAKVPPSKPKPEAKPETTVEGKVIKVHGAVVVRELAERLGLRPNQLITELMSMNILASIVQRVDLNVATTVLPLTLMPFRLR